MPQGVDFEGQRGHLAFLDVIRVVACFLVILLHVSATHFYALTERWPIFLAYDSVARMCVPLFFMLSGFLLMDSDITSLVKFYYKRYIRILIPFIVICIIYFFTPEYKNFNLQEYIYYLLNYHLDYHLWYIYVLTGLYMALPFFIKMVHGKSGLKLAILYTAIWIIAFVLITPILRYFRFEFSLMPNINYILPNGGMEYLVYEYYPNIFMNFNLFPFFFGFMGYFFCGWFVKLTYKQYNLLIYIISGIVCILSTLLVMFFTHRFSHILLRPNELFFENLSPFVFLQAVSFFCLCTAITGERPWLRELADKSFWIYLLHLLYLRLVMGIWPLPADYAAIWAVPLMSAAVFAITYFAAIPLRGVELWLLRFLRKKFP